MTPRLEGRRAEPRGVHTRAYHLLLLALVMACGADGALVPPDGAPKFGIIHVDVAMQGDHIYPDSVLLTVDSAAPLEVPSNGSHELHNIPAGIHTLSVSGVPDGCTSASATTRDVSVTGGRVTTVSFVFSCIEPIEPATGIIIFSRSTPTTASHLWMVNADGSGEMSLTSTSGAAEDISAWMPDGQRVVFGMFMPSVGSSDIAMINLDGSDIVNITNTVAHEISPAVSPDGARIAFSMYNGPGADVGSADYDIWVMDGTGRTALA